MTAAEVMIKLTANGSEQTKMVLVKHGAREPFFGVKIEHLKKIQKRVKKDHALALALYDTGNTDAMYLAVLICDPAALTKAQLNKWVKGAYWYMLSCYAVAWAAAESRFGRELALEWMKSKHEQVAAAGWSTYSCVLALTPDDELDLDEIVKLLERVEKGVQAAANRERYAMVMFVIAVGSYVAPLLSRAKATAGAIGRVGVDVGATSCKVPLATEYIAKVEGMGRVGKKRKTVMC